MNQNNISFFNILAFENVRDYLTNIFHFINEKTTPSNK